MVCYNVNEYISRLSSQAIYKQTHTYKKNGLLFSKLFKVSVQMNSTKMNAYKYVTK